MVQRVQVQRAVAQGRIQRPFEDLPMVRILTQSQLGEARDDERGGGNTPIARVGSLLPENHSGRSQENWPAAAASRNVCI